VISASTCARAARKWLMSSVCELRSRPSLSISHLAVRRFVLVSSERTPASLLTGTVVDACASLQLLFCFPLFSCQGSWLSDISHILVNTSIIAYLRHYVKRLSLNHYYFHKNTGRLLF